MVQTRQPSDPMRILQGTGLLTRAATSSLIAGVWGLTFFAITVGPTFMLMSSTVFRPIIETLWGETYFSYPYMLLSDIVGFVFMVTITAPIALWYGRNVYRVGRSMKLNSLRLIGIACLALVTASVVVVPFAYQEALEAIAYYKWIASQNALINFVFIPLGLPAIQMGLSTFVLVAGSVFILGAVEMKSKTGSRLFTLSCIFASISIFIVSPNVAIFLGLSPNTTVASTGLNSLAILGLAITVMLLGAGLGELGTRSGNWKGSASVTHGAS